MTTSQRLRNSVASVLTQSGFRSLRSLGFWIGLKAHETFYGYQGK
jgi:hypothetical protein